MADKIIIEIFKNKNTEELTKTFSAADSRLDIGSLAAVSAANAAAYTLRGANLAAQTVAANERLDYIIRNTETLRSYMVHLIDEDVKCRGPIKKALRESRPERELEACRHPAVCICEEIVNMASQIIGFDEELCDICPNDAIKYLGASAQTAWSAMESARMYILGIVREAIDDTFDYVTRRENEIMFAETKEKLDVVMGKTLKSLER